MLRVYESGDPYSAWRLAWASHREGATKQTHTVIREVFKVWLLSAAYGATEKSLVGKLPTELANKVSNPQASQRSFWKSIGRYSGAIGNGPNDGSSSSRTRIAAKIQSSDGVIIWIRGCQTGKFEINRSTFPRNPTAPKFCAGPVSPQQKKASRS